MLQLALEFLRIFLSPQAVAGGVTIIFVVVFRNDLKALFQRIAKIRFPGGIELSTSQTARLEASSEAKPPLKAPAQESSNLQLPRDLSQHQIKEISELLEAERAQSYLWEYRYLNYFLAFRTQQVLDWFASLTTRPSLSFFDTLWLPAIPSMEERQNIINALQAHRLITIDNSLIEITPKGKDYIHWRGPLARLPNA
ncbi:hypothetical protein KBZ19_05970 [Synechococcus sp. L2F]|uniref:hypothetical protein n=1 Tax=Synechococcus sp. L2F TaxID=2823739 RepID=UPI0020CD5B6D|nr:hypothetical protein [Synechococcus sp. L2F]MCP9828032.1 hypothetical protein [Synechococcus sp. L2F]